MDISLTPHELRDLLTPMLRLRGPREPLNLDAMTSNDLAGELRARLRQDAGLGATIAEGAEVGKDLLLEDLRAFRVVGRWFQQVWVFGFQLLLGGLEMGVVFLLLLLLA